MSSFLPPPLFCPLSISFSYEEQSNTESNYVERERSKKERPRAKEMVMLRPRDWRIEGGVGEAFGGQSKPSQKQKRRKKTMISESDEKERRELPQSRRICSNTDGKAEQEVQSILRMKIVGTFSSFKEFV